MTAAEQHSAVAESQLGQLRDELAEQKQLREKAEAREKAAVHKAAEDLQAAIAREDAAHQREIDALTAALRQAQARADSVSAPAGSS